MRLKSRTYSGTVSKDTSEREIRNRAVARKAAAESIVLLKNDGVLPLQSGTRVVLLGSGATQTVKGGTGSGDVNEREVTSVYSGMKAAGFVAANEPWLHDYAVDFANAREAWKQEILAQAAKNPDNPHALIEAYFGSSFVRPLGRDLTKQEIADADTDVAIYVVSRNAGEGADRYATPGDYYLSDGEKAQLAEVRSTFRRMIVVLNCGGPIDLRFLDSLEVSAMIQLSQPGMEGGHALADVIRGAVSPSGKMTDTWAYRYEDYPNSASFSHNNGNVSTELYEEGIYVGYRYFDTFGIQPRIPFGFGLSYTDFLIRTDRVLLEDAETGDPRIALLIEVTNSGANHSGKEVVQVYASCPQGSLTKEYQRLCAFGKTPLLKPGESCTLRMSFPLSQLASFSEAESAWIIEQGSYLVAVGDSSASNLVVAKIVIQETATILKTAHICPLKRDLSEIEPGVLPERSHSGEVIELSIPPQVISCKVIDYDPSSLTTVRKDVRDLVKSLDLDQLVALTCGDPGKGQDASSDAVGTPDLVIPGAAGETAACATGEPWNIASIVLADGPAGIRLAQRYSVTTDGNILKPDFVESIEHGLFSSASEVPGSRQYHQFCTAIPVGTMLAQSWDTELMEEVGKAVAIEMEEFDITLWLAPGMNIHRNPLCGRNFEYYSEDPLLSGVLAAALTSGVQSGKGIGTTIKHLVCNNQEDNRKHSDSVVSERALREIYLRGFEIAVKHSQPMAIMTSYNLVNGVHTANSHDLVTKIVRNEWNFGGVVMSDWATTGDGGSSSVECMRAGNDLIMPGTDEDMRLIREALEGTAGGSLDRDVVEDCVARLVNVVVQSNQYESCDRYAKQFGDLRPFVECRTL